MAVVADNFREEDIFNIPKATTGERKKNEGKYLFKRLHWARP
jgi:hypothetical protein